MIPALSQRAICPERMDAPDCCAERLRRTVRQFASINRLVSRYRSILNRHVLGDMAADPGRTYRFVDLGAGGCDIDAWLLRAARRRGLKLQVTALDADARVVAFARDRFGAEPGLCIHRADVLALTPDDPVDYVFANHFLHHLTEDQIVALLRTWAPRVARAVVFSDLHRTRAAYAGFALLSLCFARSFAREDGLRSIRKGFTPGELAGLAAAAGFGAGATVHPMLPGRLVLKIPAAD